MPRKLGPLIGAIDQGTSSTRFLVFSAKTGELITYHQVEVAKIYPAEGWVEQDPIQIIDTIRATMNVVADKLKALDIDVEDVQAIGVCNQRESCITWHPETGKPYYNSIVWLDNRTTAIVDHYLDSIPGRDINFHKPKTGLPISTYFSAFKLRWLIDNKPEVKKAIDDDQLLFGTIDTWILWNLAGVHMTDVTNASRTFLYDIENLRWSENMSKFFKIPLKIMPTVCPSGHHFGNVKDGPFKGVPITAVIGDQSAALVGQNCFTVGSTKATFGTGCFILQNIGSGTVRDAMRGVPREASASLLTTMGYQLKDRPPVYALEGSVAVAGAAITWLRDNISLISDYKEIEPMARSVEDAGGVFFVPAFQGLYAPYWDANAAGIVIGLSGFSRKAHVIRATLDAIAFQTVDILSLMRRDASGMMIDGGMACNDLLCQILADITGVEIIRPQTIEATALGAAMVAGNTIGVWEIREPTDTVPEPPLTPVPEADGNPKKLTKRESIMNFFTRSVSSTSGSFVRSLSSKSQKLSKRFPAGADVFYPTITEEVRNERINAWRLAIERCMKWTKIKKLEEKRVDYRRKSTIPIGFFLLSSFAILMLSNYKGGSGLS